MKSHCIFIIAAALIAFAPAGRASYRPIWIERPKSDDSIYMYRVGSATGRPSEISARTAAFENAIDIIIDEIMAICGVSDDDRPVIRGNISIKGVEIVPDALHYEEDISGVSCWVQVSCPLSERERLIVEITGAREALRLKRREREEFDAAMSVLWRQARASSLKGEHANALRDLLELEKKYADIQNPEIELEEIRILLGDTHNALKNQLAARAAYETVSGMTTSLAWQAAARIKLESLPPPPRFWPMRGRWDAGKVALFCVIREGTESRRFDDLVHVFTRDCGDAHLDCVDIFPRTEPGMIGGFFDRMNFAPVTAAALADDADVILAVACDIDPAKKGQTMQSFGVDMPVPDTIVRFFVIDTRNNRNVFNGQFREVAGGRPAHVLAERIALLLITRHLVPNCPALER